MKLCIMTDLEGVAGVFSFEQQAFPDGKYFEAAKRLLTAEVNAAVDGALAAGAEDIVVIDGHGAGGICYEMLHDQARVMQGDIGLTRADLYRCFDATCIVGQHAMEGTADGNLNHTQSSTSVFWYKLNGTPIGEAAQWALFMGALDVPTIFLSGDHAACREAEQQVPGITTAAVKQGVSRRGAISLSPAHARALIRQKMQQAIDKQRAEPVAPLKWPGPYRLEICYKHTNHADGRQAQGWQRVDSKTVAIEAKHILEIIYS